MNRTTVISVRGRARSTLIAQPGFVYVGRRCAGWPGSPFGNPFRPGMDPFAAMRVFDSIPDFDSRRSTTLEIDGPLTLEDVIAWYEAYVKVRRSLWDRLPELRGKTLGCWCVDWDGDGEPAKPCHAVVLARLADAAEASR